MNKSLETGFGGNKLMSSNLPEADWPGIVFGLPGPYEGSFDDTLSLT